MIYNKRKLKRTALEWLLFLFYNNHYSILRILYLSNVGNSHQDNEFNKTVKSLFSTFWYNMQSSNLVAQKLKNAKGSDTLFILGSGQSINEISNQNWDYISKHDSFGFNFWFVHDFVPTHYFFQAPKRELQDKAMADILSSKLAHYSRYSCKFFARGDLVNNLDFHKTKIGKLLRKSIKKVNYLPELFFSVENESSPNIILDKLYKNEIFDYEKYNTIPKTRSTLGFLISLGLMLGYKKIILCGIDMNDSGHFYDNNTYVSKYPILKEMEQDVKLRHGEFHPHMSKGKFTVKDYVLAFDEIARKKLNSAIFTVTKNSKLSPEIEYFDIDEERNKI